MASTEVSIKQLPTISSIESGNFIIVQTENSTNKLDFKDFVIGLENTTFANTVNEGTTGVDELSSVLYSTPEDIDTGVEDSISGLPITIAGQTYLIMLSAIS